MLDFAMWLGTTILLLLFRLVDTIRALVAWLQTGPGLLVVGVLVLAVWAVVLYGYRRRRRPAATDKDADEEGTATA